MADDKIREGDPEKRKKKAAPPDDEDRPRKKRRDDDDEEDEDRPRKKRKIARDEDDDDLGNSPLSAIVPVEVIFGVPGLGQLAWSGAMNRDLPVLLGVTLIMAGVVALAGACSQQLRPMETA